MGGYPQVVLFGSMQGGWREASVIPVLEELGVSYYHPASPTGEWYQELGDREADYMAHCETIVMVINTLSPAFTSLTEAGWAALGACQRGQQFILQIDSGCDFILPDSIRQTEEGRHLQRQLTHWTTSSRHLVLEHARHFDMETFALVDDLD
ncbi:MAG: hypothetical protein K8J31_30450, partial [Anaerolineae bacterium]|nr:hypothetical protein [Anaerolineae bacterium]